MAGQIVALFIQVRRLLHSRFCLDLLAQPFGQVMQVIGLMGQPGGCNPIPLKSSIGGGEIIIQAADLRALAPVFER